MGWSEYHAPVAVRVNIDKWSWGRLAFLVFFLILVTPAAFFLGLFAAPQPLEQEIATKGKHDWHKWSGPLPEDDELDYFNQHFKLKLQLTNSESDVEGLDASVDVRVRLEGRQTTEEEWEELFDTTRTRSLVCHKGHTHCRNLTLLYEPAPSYEMYRTEVEVAQNRKQAYGFISSADYVFEYSRPHWTFYEAAFKFAFLVINLYVLYTFYDNLTAGEPWTLFYCCGKSKKNAVQPEQRLVGLLLLGLLCLNDWPLLVYLLTGTWGVALLSEVAQLSAFFVLALVVATMCREGARGSRLHFEDYSGYMWKTFAVGILWAVQVSWLIYARATSSIDCSYRPKTDDRMFFWIVTAIVASGATLLIFLSVVLGCYHAGAVEAQAVVYSRTQDVQWPVDRQRRAAFFWVVTAVLFVAIGLDVMAWRMNKDVDADYYWKEYMQDHTRGATLTTVLCVCNTYVYLLAYAFTPVRVGAEDEDMISFLNKYHL